MEFTIEAQREEVSSEAYNELANYLNNLKQIGKFKKVVVINKPRPSLDFMEYLDKDILYISLYASNVDKDKCGIGLKKEFKIGKNKIVVLNGEYQARHIRNFNRFDFTKVLKDVAGWEYGFINFNVVYILFNMLGANGNIKQIMDYIILSIDKKVSRIGGTIGRKLKQELFKKLLTETITNEIVNKKKQKEDYEK